MKRRRSEDELKGDNPWKDITVLITEGIGISHAQARWCKRQIQGTYKAKLLEFPGVNDEIHDWPQYENVYVLSEAEKKDEATFIHELYSILSERFNKLPPIERMNFVKRSFLVKNPKAKLNGHKFKIFQDKGYTVSTKKAKRGNSSSKESRIDFSVYYKDGSQNVPCKRETPLITKNEELVEMTKEIISYLSADVSKKPNEGSLPYLRALSVIRVWPIALQLCEHACENLPTGVHSDSCISHIEKAHRFGASSYRNVKEALENKKSKGIYTCRKLEGLKKDPKICAVREMMKVPFVGVVTASKWYDKYHASHKLRTVNDLRELVLAQDLLELNENIRTCLKHFDDIDTPIPSEKTKQCVDECLKPIFERMNLKYEIAGGFRRGKPEGHDIDIVMSVDEELKGDNYPRVITYDEHKDRDDSRKILAEVLEQLKASKNLEVVEFLRGGLAWLSGEESQGVALLLLRFPKISRLVRYRRNRDFTVNYPASNRRVDLVMVTPQQWPYAILGWSGSKMFERSIRFYTDHLINDYNKGTSYKWNLSQKGLTLRSGKKSLKEVLCKKEEDIFKFLGLSYIAPEKRCA